MQADYEILRYNYSFSTFFLPLASLHRNNHGIEANFTLINPQRETQLLQCKLLPKIFREVEN